MADCDCADLKHLYRRMVDRITIHWAGMMHTVHILWRILSKDNQNGLIWDSEGHISNDFETQMFAKIS